MSNLSGTPGPKTSITDLSIITATVNKGKICVLAATKRGEVGKLYRVSNWTQFKRKMGGLIVDNDDALIIKTCLESGGSLIVGRMFHLTDNDDPATVTGTKSTATLASTVLESLAQGSIDITGGSSSVGVNEVSTITVNGIEILGGAIDWVTSNEATASAVAAAITANTSAPNYTATASGNKLLINGVAGSGSTPNTFVIAYTVGGDVTLGNSVAMSGGITAGAASIEYEAEAVGSGYDGTTISQAPAASNKSGFVDITIALNESDITAIITDIDQTKTTASDIANINAKLSGKEAGVVVTAITNVIPSVSSGVLSGGVQDLSELVTADYVGSSISKTGIEIFNEVVDAQRIANINKADADVDIAFVDYCSKREDMRAATRTPLGLTVSGMEDYRNGTGAYSHSAINSIYGSLWYTDALITDPNDANIKNKSITSIGYKLASRSKKDRDFGEWISDSGNQSGIGPFSKVNDVPINLISPAYNESYGDIYEQGVNAIVKHESFGVVPWGNRTLSLDKSSLLSKENIADLVVYISRSLKIIAGGQSFKPNDFEMFNELYRKARPFIISLIDGRAIQGTPDGQRGEGKWWHWLGDQFATTPEDLTFNTTDDIDQGKYRVRFAFKPIAANEYIQIDISPADSVTILNVEVLQSL